MRTIETTATVDPDGVLTARVPPEVSPGEHRVILMIQDEPACGGEAESFDFPVDDVGPWPDGLSLRREDIYGDWGW